MAATVTAAAAVPAVAATVTAGCSRATVAPAATAVAAAVTAVLSAAAAAETGFIAFPLVVVDLVVVVLSSLDAACFAKSDKDDGTF